MIERNIHDLFGMLELAGLVELHDRGTATDRWGVASHHGGTFTGTALLRHVLPPYAHKAGYDFTEVADLATAPADVVVVDAYAGGDIEAATIVGQWRVGEPLADRLAVIADIAADTDEAGGRIGAFALIDEYGNWPAAAPALRRSLDTPAGGHAALHLMEYGLATPEEVDGYMSVGPLIDHLSLLVDEPELMAALFAESQQRMVDDLIEEVWRHDQPGTLPVLEALGRGLPDKRLAKAARKAAIRHRSWLANLRD